MSSAKDVDSSFAQDLAGKAILFEIGAKAGILECLEYEAKVSVSYLEKKLGINNEFLKTYLQILESLGLLTLEKTESTHEMVYSKSVTYQKEKNKIGYIAWGMISCLPLIENTKAFINNFNEAIHLYHRQGEHVARTSKWMGEMDFYPHAEQVILNLKPKKVVDLGSGTCGLLIQLAQKLKNFQGVGVDISKDACNKAQEHINQLNLSQQIKVIVSPIQGLIQNNDVFLNADIIHAGFVFHDLLPEEEETLNKLLSTIHKTSPAATLVIVDAIPFSENQHERSFSSAFTFLHKFFMGRKLLPESDWKHKLKQSGFSNINVEPLGISGGRIFIAKG